MYGLGIKIHFNWYVIGSGYLLDAFFSTVVVNLENNKWGSRFPLIMNELNQGELNYKHAKDALDELNIIKNELMNISVDKVIWDIEDKTINGPVKYSVNPNTDNLSDYFQTSEDSDFIALLIKTIEQSILFKKNLKICKFGDWIHHPRLLAEKWDNRYNELDKKIQEELDELPFTKKKEYRLKVIKNLRYTQMLEMYFY